MLRLLLLPFRLLGWLLALAACCLLLFALWTLIPASTVGALQTRVLAPTAGLLREAADRLDPQRRDQGPTDDRAPRDSPPGGR